jgi:hypothetical protein
MTIGARNTDPITSHLAAHMAIQFSGKHADQIHAALVQFGPMSKDQIATRTGLTGVQVDRRLPELEKALRAAPTGATTLNSAGRLERVWEAVQ